jgi:hypothetical protein
VIATDFIVCDDVVAWPASHVPALQFVVVIVKDCTVPADAEVGEIVAL